MRQQRLLVGLTDVTAVKQGDTYGTDRTVRYASVAKGWALLTVGYAKYTSWTTVLSG